MSGHSKWATIKRQKGVTDAKRGQLFTKLSNAITIAAKEGGGDTESNVKLRFAIDKARASNMPKDNIERAIKRADSKEAASMTEVIYEGFGPSGVGIVVEVATDNKQRIIAEVKNIFEKRGGSIGSPGSVLHLFRKTGEIVIEKGNKSMDELLEIALENGADDIEEDGDVVIFYTDVTSLKTIRPKLEEDGFVILDAGLIYKPINKIKMEDSVNEKIRTLVEKLEDLDDVQSVYTTIS